MNLPKSGYEINLVDPIQASAGRYYTGGVIEYTKNEDRINLCRFWKWSFRL